MKKKNKLLVIRQLDRKLKELDLLQRVSLPDDGWIKAIRKALGMSQRQLGEKIGITPQSVRELEQREKEGTITLNTLKQAGIALDMQLIYSFVLPNGTLENRIEERAYAMASKIIGRTSNTMRLEDQENTDNRIKAAIDEMMEDLKRDLPGKLWD